MARRCVISGKGVQTGNTVSHSNRKARRRYLPNLQTVSLYSETLDRKVRLRVSMNGLRTVEHRGGLDAFLVSSTASDLDTRLRALKVEIERSLAARQAASA